MPTTQPRGERRGFLVRVYTKIMFLYFSIFMSQVGVISRKYKNDLASYPVMMLPVFVLLGSNI
jgi:hypothetical protein